MSRRRLLLLVAVPALGIAALLLAAVQVRQPKERSTAAKPVAPPAAPAVYVPVERPKREAVADPGTAGAAIEAARRSATYDNCRSAYVNGNQTLADALCGVLRREDRAGALRRAEADLARAASHDRAPLERMLEALRR